MMQKPRSAAYDARRPALRSCVCGTMSSTMTYSIVPAANANAKGSIALDRLTAKYPKNTPMTSTIPDMTDTTTARRFPVPFDSSGGMIIIASGMF